MLLQNSTFNHIFQGRNLNFVLNYIFFCLNILVASACKGLCLRMSFHARCQCFACFDQLFLLYTAYFRVGVRRSCCCDNEEVMFMRMFSEEDWDWKGEAKVSDYRERNWRGIIVFWNQFDCLRLTFGACWWYESVKWKKRVNSNDTPSVSNQWGARMYPASEYLFFFFPS